MTWKLIRNPHYCRIGAASRLLDRDKQDVASTARWFCFRRTRQPPSPRGFRVAGPHQSRHRAALRAATLCAAGSCAAESRGRHRAWPWYSGLGRISTADAIRFDMLKKTRHRGDVPDVPVREPCVPQGLAVRLLDPPGRLRHQHGEGEHRRCRGARSAARWFIARSSPRTGSPESWRTAAPWAVRQ